MKIKYSVSFLAVLFGAAFFASLSAQEAPPRFFREAFSIDDFIRKNPRCDFVNILVFDRSLGVVAALKAYSADKLMIYRLNPDRRISSLILDQYQDMVDRAKLRLADENLRPTTDFDAVVVYLYSRDYLRLSPVGDGGAVAKGN